MKFAEHKPLVLVMDAVVQDVMTTVVYPGILFWGGSTNSVEDRGQRKPGSGGGSQGFHSICK
jgi:hypothetical protein